MVRTLLTAVAALLISIGTAHANIIFTEGNVPQQPSEVNVFFTNGESGLTLTDGQVDHTGAGVFFTTLGSPLQVLQQSSGGNAKITCLDTILTNCIDNSAIHPPDDSQLGSISMRAGLLNGEPTAWGDAIIDLTNGVGTALVTVTDNFGAPFQYILGNGSNFLTMVATDGEFITRIDVTNAIAGAPFGFTQFDQPRVSGLCVLTDGSCAPVQTPEPGTLALLGVGLIGTGFALRRRRHQRDVGRYAIA